MSGGRTPTVLALVLLVWLAPYDSVAQIVEDCSTMAGGTHCAASDVLSTRQGCCPVGDVVAFIEGGVDWEGACGGGVETEALCLKHRTHLARWLSCLAVRVPSALVGALPAHGVIELMRAITTGTHDEIVDYWGSVWRSHRDDSFSEAEVRRIIECRPTQSTGVVYVLWGISELWVDADGATRFLFPGEGHQRVLDLRASIASIRASSHGNLIGITVMVETPSESISADSLMRMLVESVEQSGLEMGHLMWGSLLHDLQDLYEVHIRDIPRDVPWVAPGGLDTFAWKFQAMRWSPYDFSLLLDADTFLCAQSLADIWRLLQRFDLVATHAAFFFYEDGAPPGADIVARILANGASSAVPDAFVQLNTAVMAFARNARVDALLRRALELSALFLAHGYKDQAILRQALWDEPAVRLYVLPATWQCRGAMECHEAQAQNYNTGHGHEAEGVSWQPCQILHTRGITNATLPHVIRPVDKSADIQRRVRQ